MRKVLFVLIALMAVNAYSGRQTQQGTGNGNGSVININVSRSIQTISYEANESTEIDFRGTELLPRGEGQAKIESKNGTVSINAEFKGLEDPGKFGASYLVYVLWALTPDGRTSSLGQLVLNDGESKTLVSTRLQAFGLIVTAEPYFAVSVPSEKVVLENKIREDTKGTAGQVKAQGDLLQRGRYEDMNLAPLAVDPKVPLDLYQAQNAVRIAKSQGADKYASDTFQNAVASLNQAEELLRKKKNDDIPTPARQAVQLAEDARSVAIKREADELAANQRKELEAKQQAEVQGRAAAEKQQQQAEAAAAAAASARAAAEASARQQQELAQKASTDQQQLRAKLLEQFNRVLPTRDTPKGLVVNMGGDVLFDTGKADIRPAARETLAKLAGIVLNYPGLKLSIDGYTDSTGDEGFNQELSEERADAVRSYLINQGLRGDSLTAQGRGEGQPVGDNSTVEGRTRNRRVEITISGEVIGTKIGG